MMARKDEFGCNIEDDVCIIASFPEREVVAEEALHRSAVQIEQTSRGTPSGRRSDWRPMDPPSRHDR